MMFAVPAAAQITYSMGWDCVSVRIFPAVILDCATQDLSQTKKPVYWGAPPCMGSARTVIVPDAVFPSTVTLTI